MGLDAQPDDGTQPAARGPVKSAARTIDVLEKLADARHPLSLTELARELNVPLSSLHGVLQTLVDRRWVETRERGHTYVIGLRALRVGVSVLDGDAVVQAAGPILSELRARLGETVHLARLDQGDVVYLVTRESEQHLRVTSRIGRRLPAYATSLGKALLAQRDWSEVESLLPDEMAGVTPFTVSSREELRAELALAAERGWATEVNQTTVGLTCFGVAIEGDGPPMNAVSCAVPDSRVDDERATQIVAGLNDAARQLGAMMRHG